MSFAMLQLLYDIYCLGSLPAIFIIESIMEHVGEALGIPSETVKQKNLYEKGQVVMVMYSVAMN